MPDFSPSLSFNPSKQVVIKYLIGGRSYNGNYKYSENPRSNRILEKALEKYKQKY